MSGMAFADTAARKLLHGGAGGGGTVAQGFAGAISFDLGGPWQLVTGFFADIFAYLFAALAGAAHLLVLPFEELWRWLLTAVADAAGAITGFFADILSHLVAALSGAAHLLVLPFEELWRWLAAAAGAISSDFIVLWQLVTGFFTDTFAHLFAALAGAAHQLVLPLEALWQWLLTAGADLDGLWQLAKGFFAGTFVHIFAALAGAAHELVPRLEALWRWLQAAALPVALGVAAVLLLVALVWFCGPALCHAALGVCKALVFAACYFWHGLYFVAVAVHRALACLLPPCLLWCAVVTMEAPGAAGTLISRAAFEAGPALYFQILRTAGPVVASAVFCTKAVASIVAAPVTALFRVSVGA